MLPLYDNEEDEEPSSVLIWGGYAEPDAEAYKAKVYGEEQEEFRLCYRWLRLSRCYVKGVVILIQRTSYYHLGLIYSA